MDVPHTAARIRHDSAKLLRDVGDMRGALRLLQDCAQAAQWTSRLQPSPRTALATCLGEYRDQDILIDPVTDMPAVHTGSGEIETVAPQRLQAPSPLATLTIGRRSVLVTAQDGTVFLAPLQPACATPPRRAGRGAPRLSP